MQIDAEDLRRYYASLPDEALFALDRTELSEMAQKCYDEELERRELVSHQMPLQDRQDDAAETSGESELAIDEKSNWLEEAAACACRFSVYRGYDPAASAADAIAALQRAGIPCHTALYKADAPSAPPPE